MSYKPKSLSDWITWTELLKILGEPPRNQALPASASCTICETGVMKIYRDHLVGGEWFTCADCGNSGDMIELACKTWQLSMEATVIKLARTGVFGLAHDSVSIATYLSEHVEYRKRMTRLWESSQQGFLPPGNQWAPPVQQLNLGCDVSPERWSAGPGQLLGGIDAFEVERAFAPGSMEHADGNVRTFCRRRGSPEKRDRFRAQV